MKYIVDIDALVKCIDYLHKPIYYRGRDCVLVSDVKNFIKSFAKDEIVQDSGYVAEWKYWDGWEGNCNKRIDDAKCSNCGYEHPTVIKSPDNLSNYCANCGAKMKKQ